MSLSITSYSGGLYQTPFQSTFAQRSQALNSLQSALQNGDLSGARQAFSTLQTVSRNNSLSTSSTSALSQNSQIAKDFSALGTALQSGNTSDAQEAFATLKSDLQAAGLVHRAGHSHASIDSDADSDSAASITDTVDAGYPGSRLNVLA